MVIFGWVIAGIVGSLLVFSAICWGVFIAADNRDWKRLGVRVFRIAMVFVLFYVNAYIWAHVFGVASGTEKPVAQILAEEDE